MFTTGGVQSFLLGDGFVDRLYSFILHSEVSARLEIGHDDSTIEQMRRTWELIPANDPGIIL